MKYRITLNLQDLYEKNFVNKTIYDDRDIAQMRELKLKALQEGKQLDLESKLIKVIKKQKIGLYSINNSFISLSVQKKTKAIAIPLCVNIVNYDRYLNDLYNVPQDYKENIVFTSDEYVSILEVQDVEELDVAILSLSLNEISKNQLCFIAELRYNALVKFIQENVMKAGLQALQKAMNNTFVNNIIIDDQLIVNRQDYAINEFGSVIY